MRGGMLMVLVAIAMAVLLAGCGSSQREDQVSSQGSEQEGVAASRRLNVRPMEQWWVAPSRPPNLRRMKP
jgi:outer membrane murein-binding lipoprotein Lpp